MPAAKTNKLSFKPFDERGKVRIYYNGFLPHWRQVGCTYFVTFRLADSIPMPVLRQWKYERITWLAARGIDMATDDWLAAYKKLTPMERTAFERHFTSLLFSKLDEGLGQCVLRMREHAQVVSEALRHFHGQRLDTGDFVIMPNHVHALLTPYPEIELEDVMHSVKSYSANEIQRLRGVSGTLWMNESHDHIVRDGEELVRIQDYIRANPKKAGLPPDQFDLHTAEYALH